MLMIINSGGSSIEVEQQAPLEDYWRTPARIDKWLIMSMIHELGGPNPCKSISWGSAISGFEKSVRVVVVHPPGQVTSTRIVIEQNDKRGPGPFQLS
jgi:hypothetical protein